MDCTLIDNDLQSVCVEPGRLKYLLELDHVSNSLMVPFARLTVFTPPFVCTYSYINPGRPALRFLAVFEQLAF